MESGPRINPVEGCGFQAIELTKLNRLNKVRVWIPGSPGETRRGTFGVCNIQHPRAGWLFLRGVYSDTTQLISLTALRSLGDRAHVELTRVTFELPSQGRDGSS